MVNTFVTASPDSPTGYRTSASNLDNGRLWKQVLEATQILNLVRSLHILGKLFNSPCPKNPYLVKAWIKEIMTKYKQLDSYLFYHQKEYVWISKETPKPLKVKYDDKYTIEGDKILYKGKKYSKYELILPGDIFFSMGFVTHPIVICWMNHKDSLKRYINDHIDEFLSRGGKPGTRKLKSKLPDIPIEHPICFLDPAFHENHKAALLTKELARKENPWYVEKKDFRAAYRKYKDLPPTCKTISTSDFQHYIWPFAHDLDEPIYCVEEKSDGSILCSIK